MLPEVPPREHIAAFAESATRYTARLGPLLPLPHHSYRGRLITVAGMGGMACVEWHVHAWDLASALGESLPACRSRGGAGRMDGRDPACPGACPTMIRGWSVLRSAGRLP